MRWTPRRMALTATIAMATAIANLVIAVPAAHASTWTVTNGGELQGANTPSDNLGDLVFYNLTQGSDWEVTCEYGGATGNIMNGPGQPGTEIAQFTTLWAGETSNTDSCLGQSIRVSMPLYFTAESHSSGVTTGRLVGFNGAGINASFNSGRYCEATIDGIGDTAGTIGVTYDNATHTLQFTQAGTNLEVSWTNNQCFNPWDPQVGDDYMLEGKLVITPSVTITSP